MPAIMRPSTNHHIATYLLAMLFLSSCVPALKVREARTGLPESYAGSLDTLDAGARPWRQFFTDPALRALIDSALANNQELNIMLQEIAIAQSEVRARKGEYLPFMDIVAGAGLEKVGEYTRNGAVEENLDIKEGTKFPEPLPDLMVGVRASWELDIWKRLRNAKQAAEMR